MRVRKAAAAFIACSMLCPAVCSAEDECGIRVVRETEEGSSVIYTGSADGYTDIALFGDAFSEHEYFAVIDWETGDVIHIFKTEQQSESIGSMTETTMGNIQMSQSTGNTYIQNVQVGSGISAQIETQRTNESITASFSFSNMSENAGTVYVAGAVYKNGRMLLVDTDSTTTPANGIGSCQMTLTADENMMGADVKFFAWSSESMVPHCEAVLTQFPAGTENEISEGVETLLRAGESYLFKPKRDGVHTFSGGDVTLYKMHMGNIVQIETSTCLKYPDSYRVEVGEDSVVTVENTAATLNGQAFVSDGYYSDMSDGGSIYNGGIRIYTPLSRWLFKGTGIYFNSDGLKSMNTDTHEVSALLGNVNPYFTVSDGEVVYFSDMNRGGKIYRYEEEELTLVCKDSAAWLKISGDYIYYKNLLDGGSIYKIEKTAVNAENGIKAEGD